MTILKSTGNSVFVCVRKHGKYCMAGIYAIHIVTSFMVVFGMHGMYWHHGIPSSGM